METTALLNRIWSRTLLEELSRLGVEQVCAAPGSRSTPLILEAQLNPKLTLHTHFDERGLGFMALGLAKASQQPVAIIVTSGTAVANLLPAIVEAGLTREKLVVLTADRPVELIDCGANQAIRQPTLFAAHATESIVLPSPSHAIPLTWLLTTIDQAMFTQQQVGGAIHFNCPYPEPLYLSAAELNQPSPYWQTVEHWYRAQQPYTDKRLMPMTHRLATEPDWNKKGLIIIGAMPFKQAQQVKLLADNLGWPVLCDPQSGLSSDWDGFDIWLQHPLAFKGLAACECIIQCGSRVVSKRLNQWLAKQGALAYCDYWYVSADQKKDNQHYLPQHHCVIEPGIWATASLNALTSYAVSQAGWADALTVYARQVATIARHQLAEELLLSELALALDVTQWSQGTDLFIGNSLIIRLVDMFSDGLNQPVYTNRGASGIDGLVATAAGVQRATRRPLILLIGDTSLLHDMNSLALLAASKQPVIVVVTNNDGGAIFDLLPVPEQEKRALYQVPHGMNFEHAAAQFGLRYANPGSYSSFYQCVDQHLAEGQGSLLIEITTDNGRAASQIRAILEQYHAG